MPPSHTVWGHRTMVASRDKAARGASKGPLSHVGPDSGDLYKVLFETMLQGVVLQDADGRIVSMNPAAERILGRSQEEFKGETSVSAEHTTTKEDGTEYPGIEYPPRIALKTGKIVRDSMMRYYNPLEKAYKWINISAIPLFKEGSDKPYQVYTIFDDVTERKEIERARKASEDSYRYVINTAPWGLHFYRLTDDDRLIFTGANPAADRILGISHSSLFGLTLEEAFPASAGTEISSAYRKVARTGEPWHSERVNYADGRIKGAFEVHAFQPSPGIVAVAFLDITARARNEEDTRKLLADVQHERDRLTLLMNSMTDEVWFADKEGKFVMANAAALRSFGIELLDEAIDVSKMATSLEVHRLDGSYRPADEAPPLRALKGEVVSNEEEIVRLPGTGQLRYRRVTASPVRDSQGNIIGSVSVVQDITERVASEEELRNTRNYLESLFDHANAPIIVWDPSFKITRFNHAFEHMTGHSADEVIGRDLTILFPAESRGRSLERIQKTLTGEYWESVEIPIMMKDGSVRIALWNSANVYGPDGRTLVGTIAQGVDITGRKSTEDELRSTRDYLENLFDHANAPIIVWDPSYKITRFNHAFEHMTGYSADEVIGKDLSVLMPARSRASSLTKIERAASGEYWESVEIPILRKDGAIRVALWNSANLTDRDGNTLVATIAQGQDITERKEGELKLKEYSENLARSNTELQGFAYAASHDLREPLRTISGFLQIVDQEYGDKLDAKAKDYIDRTIKASNRLHAMIDDLLSFSRLETRKKPFAPVNLNDVLTASIHDLDAAIKDHRATVSAEPLPTVMADDQQMAILFRNLIDNGVKFHGKQRPVVQIKSTRRESEWLLTFRDNGIGIDPASLAKVFVMFTRLHSWKEYPGNGIGLAMCKKIVERHGGHIWVESEVGVGSTFFVTLPDRPPDIGSGDAGQPPQPEPPNMATALSGSTRRVRKKKAK